MSFDMIKKNIIWEKSKTMLDGYRQPYSLHKSKYIFIGILKDVKIKFDTSNYKLKGTLPKGKVKKLSD